MRFADILGQEDLKNTLVGSIQQNHLAHALLFHGPQGSANLALALALATYVNCTDPTPTDACGRCESCLKMQKFIHPDLHFAFPVSSTPKITGSDVVSKSFLKEWRSFLETNPYGTEKEWSSHFGGENKQLNISKEESRQIIKALALKAFEGRYKVMLIWLPEFMHNAAANGILKILEEPPERTLFFLVTHNREALLTTILSRVQQVTVPPFADAEVKTLLSQNYQVPERLAEQLAYLANGNLNEALKLRDEVEDDSHEFFRQWMRYCYSWDFKALVGTADDFHKFTKMVQKSLLAYGLTIMRETLLAHYQHQDLLRLAGKDQEFVQKFGQVMDPEKVSQISALLNEAAYHLERNASPKITFLDVSLQIARVLRAQ